MHRIRLTTNYLRWLAQNAPAGAKHLCTMAENCGLDVLDTLLKLHALRDEYQVKIKNPADDTNSRRMATQIMAMMLEIIRQEYGTLDIEPGGLGCIADAKAGNAYWVLDCKNNIQPVKMIYVPGTPRIQPEYFTQQEAAETAERMNGLEF